MPSPEPPIEGKTDEVDIPSEDPDGSKFSIQKP